MVNSVPVVAYRLIGSSISLLPPDRGWRALEKLGIFFCCGFPRYRFSVQAVSQPKRPVRVPVSFPCISSVVVARGWFPLFLLSRCRSEKTE